MPGDKEVQPTELTAVKVLLAVGPGEQGELRECLQARLELFDHLRKTSGGSTPEGLELLNARREIVKKFIQQLDKV